MKRCLVLFVLVAACSSGGSAAPTTTATTDPNVAPAEAVDVCRTAVKDRVVTPATARFDTAAPPQMNTAGSSWQIRGIVESDNGAGTFKRIAYSCLVNPSTLAGDSTPWVIGDVTVTPA